jgi:hypothetical protein
MIRIDEIYYNTFLPVIQRRPFQSMHWFDPFGSVNFEDLRSAPEVSAAMPDNPMLPNNDVVRFVFWDQEPLHKHTVDKTLTQYRRLFHSYCHPTTHMITSEYRSDMVQYVQDTYGFIMHYYFFHGWAALDWFRGYNRSMCILPPEQRKISKTFIMPNRIVGGERQHRLLMFYLLLKNGIADNHVSFPKICPVENVSTLDLAKGFQDVFPDIVDVLAEHPLPLEFDNEHNHPMDSYKLSLFDQATESLLYVVTETVATGRRQHVTEKTFKPICLQMPFVVVATAGTLEYLRSYGFKTFADVWDESYDEETDDLKRYEKIADLLKDLHSCSMKEKQRIFENTRQICAHNYQHFYGGHFENILWKELTSMIKEFDV